VPYLTRIELGRFKNNFNKASITLIPAKFGNDVLGGDILGLSQVNTIVSFYLTQKKYLLDSILYLPIYKAKYNIKFLEQ